MRPDGEHRIAQFYGARIWQTRQCALGWAWTMIRSSINSEWLVTQWGVGASFIVVDLAN